VFGPRTESRAKRQKAALRLWMIPGNDSRRSVSKPTNRRGKPLHESISHAKKSEKHATGRATWDMLEADKDENRSDGESRRQIIAEVPNMYNFYFLRATRKQKVDNAGVSCSVTGTDQHRAELASTGYDVICTCICIACCCWARRYCCCAEVYNICC